VSNVLAALHPPNAHRSFTKAQGVVAIAGVFLAGVFSLVKDKNADVSSFERAMLLSAILLLGASVWFAIRTMRVRDAPRHPTGAQLDTEINTVVRVGNAPESAIVSLRVTSASCGARRTMIWRVETR